MSVLLQLGQNGCRLLEGEDQDSGSTFCQVRIGYSFENEPGIATDLAWGPKHLVITTDHVGCYPVYIAHSGGAHYIGTNPWRVARAAGLRTIDLAAAVCLLAYEYVPGAGTLISGLQQLPVAHQIEFRMDGQNWVRQDIRYWRYARHNILQGLACDEIASLAAENLRQICAPIAGELSSGEFNLALNLSGGWDSRALLACFIEQENLFTCTYGDPRSSGVVAARRSAASVGVPNSLYPFESGEHLRQWHLKLCALQPPVCRFNLSDGGYAVATNFYENAMAAMAGHSGDVFTTLPGMHASTLQIPQHLISFLERNARSSFPSTLLRKLLRTEHQSLADAPDETLRDLVPEMFVPGAAGPIRWKLEQRLRRLIVPELQVLLRYVPKVYTPLLQGQFIDFWSRVPDDELREQLAYRRMLARHLFQGRAKPLLHVPREGGGFVTESSRLARSLRKLRMKGLHGAQRVFPGTFNRLVVTDPTAAWWFGDTSLRRWACETLQSSATVQELFQLPALVKTLENLSPAQTSLAQTGVWSLLTIAGVEVLLRSPGNDGKDYDEH